MNPQNRDETETFDFSKLSRPRRDRDVQLSRPRRDDVLKNVSRPPRDRDVQDRDYIPGSVFVRRAVCTSVAEDMRQPYRELFVWAVFCCRMSLAMIFWKECLDQVGSGLMASLMFSSLVREAKGGDKQMLTNDQIRQLNHNARSVIAFCEFVTKKPRMLSLIHI